MTKYCIDAAMDAALDHIKNNSFWVVACASAPATYDTAMGSVLVARQAITSAYFSGPIDGATSGRRLVADLVSVVVSVTGTPNHLVLLSSAGASTVLYTTETSTTAAFTAGAVMTVGVWSIEIADPA